MQFESNKIEDYATFFFNLNNLNIILWKKSFIHVFLQSMSMNKNVSLSCGPSNKKILSVIILTGVTKKWLFLYFADVIELLMCLGSGSLKTMFFYLPWYCVPIIRHVGPSYYCSIDFTLKKCCIILNFVSLSKKLYPYR